MYKITGEEDNVLATGPTTDTELYLGVSSMSDIYKAGKERRRSLGIVPR